MSESNKVRAFIVGTMMLIYFVMLLILAFKEIPKDNAQLFTQTFSVLNAAIPMALGYYYSSDEINPFRKKDITTADKVDVTLKQQSGDNQNDSKSDEPSTK